MSMPEPKYNEILMRYYLRLTPMDPRQEVKQCGMTKTKICAHCGESCNARRHHQHKKHCRGPEKQNEGPAPTDDAGDNFVSSDLDEHGTSRALHIQPSGIYSRLLGHRGAGSTTRGCRDR